ncbi:INO80 complex subunit C-like [Ruditapes philippinarum]|uniref:INO80 complex subunit C-like n=1 Tax=Ruditapes philippinarum TaxID=129788 RepID=UPI00295C3340|nr:INO80 complex subunit C-like [Ruditapes philippinarum]
MATPSKQRKTSKNIKQTSSPSLVKKKSVVLTKTETDVISVEQELVIGSFVDTDESHDSPVNITASNTTEKAPVFKNPNFVHSSIGSAGSKKTRVWKNLKQIVAAERALPWQPDDTTYGMIEAPPSFKPAMKYSDISGLPAKYTDPQTKLRYTTAEEFSRIKMMPSDLVTGCLTLRRANIPV